MSDQALGITPSTDSRHGSYAMSWTAYIRPTIVLLIGLSVAVALYNNQHYPTAGICGVFFLLMAVYQFLSIRSVHLYTDDDGVWVYSGILPWSKGVSGVKWRDLDEAIFFTGFWSWLLRSYTIRVGHRFTKDSEIVLPHIARGKDAVEHINDLHRRMINHGRDV